MIKLLFVDDQAVTLRFLENCFGDADRYEIVGSLIQAEIADLWCERKKPDAVFLDIQTKEKATNGLEMAKRIKEKFPQIKILMMTGFDEISYIPRAKEIGVDAFLLKSYPEEKFVQILQEVVYEGRMVFPEENNQIPVEEGQTPLTEREIEVLRLICQDHSNKEIADSLYVTESTVKRHVESLLRKTGKSGRAGLVAYAIAGGWINPNI